MEPVDASANGRTDDGSRAGSLVVVGIDGSYGSREALVHALTAAHRRGADLDVVSTFSVEVFYPGGVPLALPNVEAIRDATRERAQALIEEVQDDPTTGLPAGGREPRIRPVVVEGIASQVLIQRSVDADLLVVGSRGRGALRSLVLGSVALHCVTHARCPVVVVHSTGQAGRSDRIVVGVDGSPGSRVALRAAIDEAARTGAAVEVVVALYLLAETWTELSATVEPPTVEGVGAELVARTEKRVADVLAERADDGSAPPIHVEVVEGPAADVLVQQARDAGLLVVGSRGWGAFRGLLLGSVALHCAMHAHCPVMVVHPRDDLDLALVGGGA